MKFSISLLLVCLSAALVRAQTQTIVDPAGDTVVIFVTLDPALGVPTTETLLTVVDDDETTATTGTGTRTTATSTSSSTSSSTGTTTTLNQGPVVGQPAATVAGQTTYQYTTTDALGNTQVLTDIFTPSTAVSPVSVTTFDGTVLDYSSWVGLVGTNTVASALDASSGGRLSRLLPKNQLWAGAAAFVGGTLGGAWLVFV